MPVLPSNPSFDQLKNQAKELRRACMAGESDAVARVRALHPAYSDGSKLAGELSLRDAQMVIARDHHFENWARLKEYCTWDVAVIDQDVPRVEALLKEKPERSRQEVMRFRRNGTHWLTPSVSFANNNVPMATLLMDHGATLSTPGRPVLQPTSTPDYIDFTLAHGADLEGEHYNGTVLSIGPNGLNGAWIPSSESRNGKPTRVGRRLPSHRQHCVKNKMAKQSWRPSASVSTSGFAGADQAS